jgi:hypothetical protein
MKRTLFTMILTAATAIVLAGCRSTQVPVAPAPVDPWPAPAWVAAT